MKRYKLFNGTKIEFESPSNHSFKFGYYNYSPINEDGTKLLGHKIPFEGRMPNSDDKVEIGYFNLENGGWNKLAQTSAFNWQQGAMLQWLNNGKGDRLIFNDAKEGKYVSRILDIKTGEEKELPKAIYGITPDGNYAVTLNFERCHYTRAYSYATINDDSWAGKNPEKDGIILLNLNTGQFDRIIALHEMIEKIDGGFDQNHWFEHIMLDPTGKRFAFYLRSELNNGFETRCFTANIDGTEIWEHSYKQNHRLTHLGWRNATSYVIYTIAQTNLKSKWTKSALKGQKPKWYVQLYRKGIKPFIPRKIVRKLPKGNSYYALTEDRNGIIGKLDPFPGEMDGHPSFTKDGRFMLTDTYADKEGYRHLLLFEIAKKKSIRIGSFYSEFNNCGWRADLHPRFSPDENRIVIDSSHDGYHKMMVLYIDWSKLKSRD